MKPWAGLAIGVQAWDLAEAGEALDSGTVLALQAATKDCRRPADIGAYALGLGMSKTVDAIPTLVEKLDFFTGSDEARGYCVALGLIETRAPSSRSSSSSRSPSTGSLLHQVRRAGPRRQADRPARRQAPDAQGMATQAAIASALGQIGEPELDRPWSTCSSRR